MPLIVQSSLVPQRPILYCKRGSYDPNARFPLVKSYWEKLNIRWWYQIVRALSIFQFFRRRNLPKWAFVKTIYTGNLNITVC